MADERLEIVASRSDKRQILASLRSQLVLLELQAYTKDSAICQGSAVAQW